MQTMKFNYQGEDTCLSDWSINFSNDDELMIHSVEIAESPMGCKGHPKTIMALIKDIPYKNINIEGLKNATCPRGKSCGMILAKSLEKIHNS
jgi:hypothetical protein